MATTYSWGTRDWRLCIVGPMKILIISKDEVSNSLDIFESNWAWKRSSSMGVRECLVLMLVGYHLPHSRGKKIKMFSHNKDLIYCNSLLHGLYNWICQPKDIQIPAIWYIWRSQLTLTKTSSACPSHMIVGSPQSFFRNHQPTLAGTPLMEEG